MIHSTPPQTLHRRRRRRRQCRCHCCPPGRCSRRRRRRRRRRRPWEGRRSRIPRRTGCHHGHQPGRRRLRRRRPPRLRRRRRRRHATHRRRYRSRRRRDELGPGLGPGQVVACKEPRRQGLTPVAVVAQHPAASRYSVGISDGGFRDETAWYELAMGLVPGLYSVLDVVLRTTRSTVGVW